MLRAFSFALQILNLKAFAKGIYARDLYAILSLGVRIGLGAILEDTVPESETADGMDILSIACMLANDGCSP